MLGIWYAIFVLPGLVRASDSDITSILDYHRNNIGQAVNVISDTIEKEASPHSDYKTSELIARLIQNSGGSTPQEISPMRFNPSNGRPEYVVSSPKPIAELYRTVNFAALSYCLPTSITSMSCKACRLAGPGVEVVEIFTESLYAGRAVLLLDRNHRQAVLSFRGSILLEHWIQDIKYLQSPVSYAKDAKVQLGFKQAHYALFSEIFGTLKATLNKHPSYQLIVTGHSLGGALATLMTSELLHRKALPPNRLSLITYGEPRVGNLAFVRWLNAHPTPITRVVNENDLVPHIVPPILGYAHHATEVYIRNNRSTVCSNKEIEDITCSLSRYPALSLMSHLKAWDLGLGIFAC